MTATLITSGAKSHDLVEDIAWVARISNPANRASTDTSEGLVRYLVRNKHWSPFEMFSPLIEITTTRDIGRQILRHRSFSFQEFSQRYAEVDTLQSEYREGRLQDTKNRQNSLPSSDAQLESEWLRKQAAVLAQAEDSYAWAIKHGIAKEQARCVLPEGMTTTTMLMSGTLRSWMHYIELRTEKGTQKEHRQVALECAEALRGVFPMIMEAVHNGDK